MRTTTGAPPAPEQALNILLIEQKQAEAESHKVRLERDGYSVEHALEGSAAMELAIRRPPDLIFLSLRLPGILEAMTVLEQLRQNVRTQHVPVVILSSETDFELVKDRLNLGALDHVVTTNDPSKRLAGEPEHGKADPQGDEQAAGELLCALTKWLT